MLDDSSLYVRRAVANCLNDVGKDNPDTRLRWSERWSGGGPERRWTLARGLRSQVKRGHPQALRLMGLSRSDALSARWVGYLGGGRVRINQHLLIEVEVANAGSEPARVLAQAMLSGPGRGKSPRVRRYRIGAADILATEAAVIAGRIHSG